MSNEEAINIIKSECYVFNPHNFDKSTKINTALDIAIKALEKQDRIAQILDDYDLLETWEVLDDYDLLEAWEVLKMIKEEIKKKKKKKSYMDCIKVIAERLKRQSKH